MTSEGSVDFLARMSSRIDRAMTGKGSLRSDREAMYLQQCAANICEWVTGVEYWNVPSTFGHNRQYQIMRDTFSLRCPICNSMQEADIDCWGKSRMYLESENLLVWSEQDVDFVCPKCKETQRQLIADEMFVPYNEMIILAGMRSGKSYLGAHIGGYFEHFLSTRAMRGIGTLQRFLKQEKAEWFEITFAASTATQAAQTIYAKYREMRKNSPWCSKYSKWVLEKEARQVGSETWSYKTNDDAILDGWAKVRYNRIASDSRGVAGKTRIAAFIDEWARLADTEGTRSATELYRVLNQSLKTVRAASEINHLPAFLGMMVNVTSPIAQDDPAMETYNKAMEGELKRTYGWKGPTWEFNPNMPRYLFDEEYVKDPVAAERDFGSNPPNAEMPWVEDPLRFWKSVETDRKPIAEFVSTYLDDKTGKEYVGAALAGCDLDHVNTHYLFADAGLTWDSFGLVCAHPEWLNLAELGGDPDSPFRPPEIARGRINPVNIYETMDLHAGGSFLSSNNPLGIGADAPLVQDAYVNSQRMQRYQDGGRTGNPYDHMGEILCTVIDFALRIVPTGSRDIWFNSIVNIIEGLQKKIRIAQLSTDHWNSESTIQQLRTMDIMADKIVLKPDHFMSFLRMAYNGRVRMLPPASKDLVGLSDTGALVIGTPQEEMEASSVALVECLKLTRSPDLRKFYNPKKGQVRGRDSDDLARCYVGVHHLVQHSIVDEMANSSKRNAARRKLIAEDSMMSGTVYSGKGGR